MCIFVYEDNFRGPWQHTGIQLVSFMLSVTRQSIGSTASYRLERHMEGSLILHILIFLDSLILVYLDYF
jgi:hypothetical protein